MKIENYLEKLSVLVIEDNQGDFVLIEDNLLDKFKLINIIHCHNYAMSVNYLESSKEKPAVILLDLQLPDFSGLELINSIIKCSFHIPIIILTGYSDIVMANNSLKVGIYDYLIKDEVTPAILHKTIVFALNRSRFINQIEHEKRNYENLFNFNPQPTWLLDSQSLKILHANIAAQKKYGFSLDNFLKMKFTQLHPQNEEELIIHKLVSKKNEVSRNHYTHILNGGIKIKVDIYFKEITTISNNDIIIQANDISDILKHINTIEIQNTKLKDIAWTQSHVVRAPLARILGLINLIEENRVNDEELLFCLKQLKISGIEMDDVIKKIIDHAIQINLD